MKRLVYHRHIDKLSAFSIMVNDDLKPQYGAFLARQPEPFEAALMLFPADHGRAAWIAINWAHDPLVLAERDRVKRETGESMLPDKTQLCEVIWDMVSNTNKYMAEDRIKAAKLYAEVRGFITKAAPVQTTTINNTAKVIQTKDHGSDDEWESSAEKQQRELLNVATSRH